MSTNKYLVSGQRYDYTEYPIGYTSSLRTAKELARKHLGCNRLASLGSGTYSVPGAADDDTEAVVRITARQG